MAHRGVLFLDELCEFRRAALEALCGPLDSGEVEIARGSAKSTLPADFQLIAAANPCPCGWGEGDARCVCSEVAIRRYRFVLCGALSDRIDLHVKVTQPRAGDLAGSPGESSASVRSRVTAARERMKHRYYGQSRTNAKASPAEVAAFRLDREALAVFASVGNELFTGRNGARVMKLARTLADLADVHEIREQDIDQALDYAEPRQPAAA